MAGVRLWGRQMVKAGEEARPHRQGHTERARSEKLKPSPVGSREPGKRSELEGYRIRFILWLQVDRTQTQFN